MKKGLGKGLNALFSIFDDEKDEINTNENDSNNINTINSVNNSFSDLDNSLNNSGVIEINIRNIEPNNNQPRKKFDANSLKELSESIKIHGVIQPIIVNKKPNNKYLIIAGERRFRASIIAGLQTIPAIVKEFTDKEVREVSLIENLQREDLNPIEAAKAIKELMDKYSFTQEVVAERIGKSRPLVANTLRLLSLCPEVISMIENNQISAGHGKCLVSVNDPNKQIEFAKYVVENKLNVRDLENLIKNDKLHDLVTKKKKEKLNQSIELKELKHRLARLFKTKVSINGDDNKGKILISYFNVDDLDRIIMFLDKFERM